MKKTRIIRNKQDAEQFADAVRKAEIAVPLRVTVERYVKNRSLAQNNLFHFWMNWLAKYYHEHYGKSYSLEAFKVYFKDKFLGYEAVEIFGGKIKTRLISTTSLNVVDFAEFLDKVDNYCAEELEIVLPHPDDMFNEAMGK